MFRTGYNSDPDKDSLDSATVVECESLTQQCFLEDCSIQTMVERSLSLAYCRLVRPPFMGISWMRLPIS